MAFRDGDGNLLPVTGGGALFDEQGMVPDAISQLNSMYYTRSRVWPHSL